MLISENSSGYKQKLEVPKWIVVIGANTGGPQALLQLLPQFPAHFSGAIVVVQQMRPGFTRVLVDQLSQVCKLPVCEPDDGQALRSGQIIIAPVGSRLIVANVDDSVLPAYSVFLEEVAEQIEIKHSRTDAAMTSAADVFKTNSIGVLLTGLGTDGREGMRAIRASGGITLAQDQASSVVHDLAASAIEAEIVQDVLPLWSIANHIVNIVEGEAHAAAA